LPKQVSPPGGSLAFLVVHFDKAWKPLVVYLAGLGLMFIGTLFGGLGHEPNQSFTPPPANYRN